MRLTKQYAYGLLASAPEELYMPIYHELKTINELLKAEKSYVNIIEFDREEFKELREILKEDYQPLLINFLEVLAEDGLLNRLDTIVEDYQYGLIEKNVLYEAEVASATPLSSEFKEKIKQFIGQRWGENYLLNFQVDEKLIGGVRLQINDAVIDTTFRSRINQILREV